MEFDASTVSSFPQALKPLLLSSFATALLSLGGCGYSLQLAGEGQAPEDPVTILRREVRQLKADHRVQLFDLQKAQEKQLESMKSELKDKLKTFRSDLGRKRAESDEKFSEITRQYRLIHGRIDESENRSKERSESANRFALGELQRVSDHLKKEQAGRKSLLQNLNAQVDDLHKKEGVSSQSLQNQLQALQKQTTKLEAETQRSQSGSASDRKAISQQVSELIKKALPALNRIAARMDDLEWKFDKLKVGVDTDELTARLGELSEAIDVQRQSLEMLGNTLVSKVDQQARLLKQSTQRLDQLETK